MNNSPRRNGPPDRCGVFVSFRYAAYQYISAHSGKILLILPLFAVIERFLYHSTMILFTFHTYPRKIVCFFRGLLIVFLSEREYNAFHIILCPQQ